MAYSILSKEGRQGNIIHFLADSANDYPFIIDACDPGSTITILEEKNKKTVYMKAPSGLWVIIEGESDKTFPANDAEVIVPEDNFEIHDLDGRPVSDFQSDVKVYPTGLVTGNSHYAENNKLFGTGDESKGHYITFVLPKPKDATKVKLSLSNNGSAIDIPDDNTYMFRLDKARETGKDTATISFSKGDNGDTPISSFAFNLSKVVFD